MPPLANSFRKAAKTLFATSLVLPAGADEGINYFETHIRPLFAKHCYECHSEGAKKLKANLYLDSRAGWETGGDSGPALIPGKPDESLIIEVTSHLNSDLQMPPDEKLSDDKIEKLRTWITMGAPDPRDGVVKKSRSKIDLEKGRQFWAFKPPVAHPTPKVEDATWPRNDIDRFVLARLESEKLTPTKDAKRQTLLRRIYYDLIGLPPSPEELKNFLADQSPKAFEKVVDDLLARPDFGERWGRHWLDVARFAESSGGGRSMIFPHAWRFRDYIIKSFNEDKPFDQLVREHLAGDLLPHESPERRNEQLVGSGYLVLGAMNYELQDQERLRMEFVDEQIDTMGRTFLGMTLGCARCHDHKFDPIPTTDYYALAGIFQSTESMGEGSAASGVSSVATVKLETSNLPELKKHRAELASLQKQITQLKKKSPGNSSTTLPEITIDSDKAKLTGIWKPSTHTANWVGENYLHDNNQGKGEKAAEFTAALPESRDYEVLISYSSGSGRSKKAPVTIFHAEGETTILLDQTKPPTHHESFASVGSFSFSKDQPARIVISNKGTTSHVIVDAVGFVGPDTGKKVEKPKIDRAAINAEIKALEKQHKDLDSKIKKLEPMTMAPRESKNPADGHVHIRGLVRNKGPKIPRGFISVATDPRAALKIPAKSSGRLELAHWVADGNNPLTSRVMVNRIWKHLLGEGLVRTPDNFGETGELPSHPELLDYLALNFTDSNWSVKTIIREIALSRTYQLSSLSQSDQDPENRLLARANRKRLEAECIRDTALLVSGKLDPNRSGPTIKKAGKYDLNYKFNTSRKSIYTPWFRNSMIDLFEVFDAPNPNLVVGKRTTSNIPTQSLFLMNSPFIREQSILTAKQLIGKGAKIEDAYLILLGRRPSTSEQATTSDFLSQFPPDQQEEAWTQLCQTLFSCVDFRFLD
ncbi:MAG: hypothetical protein CBC46_12545 [Verrucomicrobiaceae bacterium TMED86]|nr:MAG: hypothetical protein CBC46_12545 [Verrucomicrobiaceae bacterium TMED86]